VFMRKREDRNEVLVWNVAGGVASSLGGDVAFVLCSDDGNHICMFFQAVANAESCSMLYVVRT